MLSRNSAHGHKNTAPPAVRPMLGRGIIGGVVSLAAGVGTQTDEPLSLAATPTATLSLRSHTPDPQEDFVPILPFQARPYSAQHGGRYRITESNRTLATFWPGLPIVRLEPLTGLEPAASELRTRRTTCCASTAGTSGRTRTYNLSDVNRTPFLWATDAGALSWDRTNDAGLFRPSLYH